MDELAALHATANHRRVYRLLRVISQTVAVCVAGVVLSSCQSPVPVPSNGTSMVSGTSAANETSAAMQTFATGLDAPWSMVPLPDATVLVSERDSGQIVEVSASGSKHVVGQIPGVQAQGEGGLLGLAVLPGNCGEESIVSAPSGCQTLFAYLTTERDNRIVSLPLKGSSGARSLGPASVIIERIPSAGNHNGGRIAFGPDGMLYASSGDAGNRQDAQNPDSLSGKILRLMPDGGIPADNPWPGSPVWSLGHRNPQGLAWDEQGRMWASEFGQNSWDELNEIKPGGNYGWPEVEGLGGDPRFTDPVLSWPTDEASPSGIAVSGNTLYMAALRGERLWAVDLSGSPQAEARLVGQLGRLRDVALTDDGQLLVLTNNTDGRGTPQEGDDKIVTVRK